MSGEVPEGWKRVTLSDAATVVTGKTPSTKEPTFWDGDIPFVTPSDLTEAPYVNAIERFVTEAGANTGKMVPAGSVAFTCIASIGKSALTIEPSITNQQINSCIPKAGVDAYFLLQSLRQHTPEIQAISGTTAVPIINKTQFSGIQLSLPPLLEQQKIAEILTSVDEAIQATEAVIEQTKKVKQGVMNQLLTKGIGHTRFKQTEIGEIPEGWEVHPIGDLLESSQYGINKSLSADPLGYPVLRMGNIQDFRLDLSSLKYAELDESETEQFLLRRDDIIFNRTNSLDLVGKVALIDVDLDLSFASYNVRLRVERSRAIPDWLFANLSSRQQQHRLRALATPGASQANINPTKLKQLKLATPSIVEQRKITNHFDSIESNLAVQRSRIQNLRSVKSALMSDLLTGRKRVVA